jgi:gliding motility-associated-like protein
LFKDSLGVINNPNDTGLACNYVDAGLYLGGGGKQSQAGLPNFISSLFMPVDFTAFPLCLNDTTWFSINDTTEVDSVSWDFGDPTTGPLNSSKSMHPSHIYSDTGTFLVRLIYWRNSSSDTLEKDVEVLSNPIVDLGNDTSICDNGSITLNAGFAGATYLWSTGDTSKTLLINSTGIYGVAVDVAGCIGTDSVQINISAPIQVEAGPDRIAACEPVELLASSSGVSFEWTPPTGIADPNILQASAFPDQETVYTLTATDGNGCTASDSVTVTTEFLEGIEMPNAFSPNGDGHNDKFRPIHKCIDEAYFTIHNRYGKIIFETKDLDVEWDGTFRGEPQPTGTYVYVLIGSTSSGKEFNVQGNISIIR